STYTVYGEGEYWVTVIDSCGNMQTDTIEVFRLSPTIAMVEPQIATFCPPSCVTFTVQNNFFDHFKWEPSDYLDCDTCQTVTACPLGAFQYILIAWTDAGCYSVDTVFTQTTSYQTSDDFIICTGESILINGQMISNPGTYTEMLTAVNGCDSTHTVTLQNYPETSFSFSTTPACTGSNNGSATVIVNTGQPPYVYNWSVAGGNTSTITDQMAGNYTVTITDGNNCTVIGNVEIPEDNSFDIAANTLGETCLQENDGRIEITAPVGAAWTYSLDNVNFQSSPIFENLAPADYTVYVTDGICEYQTQVTISAGNNFEIGITASPSTTIQAGESADLQITNLPTNVDTIEWENTATLSCEDCPNPTATPNNSPTTYTATVTDVNGCLSTASITLTFPCIVDLQIPNVFTPDGDGVNDDFGPVIGEGIEMVSSIKIFNRWGEKVYESSGNDARWDGTVRGKLGTSDVYVYIITIVCPDGEKQHHGDVTLIR
ncbi:MAG TPA: T9SS type B sorting domain-containing protein, partial [Phaeodactylibacter sp.]|nr:T9SS type B sorting domain-containing protein [Phaeodactylibacter sp.]